MTTVRHWPLFPSLLDSVLRYFASCVCHLLLRLHIRSLYLIPSGLRLYSAGGLHLHKEILCSWKQAGLSGSLYLLAVHGDEREACMSMRGRPGKQWRKGGGGQPVEWHPHHSLSFLPKNWKLRLLITEVGREEEKLGCEWETVDHMCDILKEEPQWTERFSISLEEWFFSTQQSHLSLSWMKSFILAAHGCIGLPKGTGNSSENQKQQARLYQEDK